MKHPVREQGYAELRFETQIKLAYELRRLTFIIEVPGLDLGFTTFLSWLKDFRGLTEILHANYGSAT